MRIIALILILPLPGNEITAMQPGDRPNFVILVSEDNYIHFMEHFSLGGEKTPNIESLADGGVAFDHTGDFTIDAFDNHMTGLAVSNPVKTSSSPGILYDRYPGYGMLIFDTEERTIRCECWLRHVDTVANLEGQYSGWPIVIDQQENDGRNTHAYLHDIEIEGLTDSVLQVFKQETGELEYSLRIKGLPTESV